MPPFERCFAVVTSGHFVVKIGYFGSPFIYGTTDHEFAAFGKIFLFYQIANTCAQIFANFGVSKWSSWWSSEMTNVILRQENANFRKNTDANNEISTTDHKNNKEYQINQF